MHVWVMHQRRSPRVQHGGDADPGTEALWVGCDGERGFGRRLGIAPVDVELAKEALPTLSH
jgi:hypothetical protein